MDTENDSQEEITVEVTVPEPEPAPEPEPSPTVVIVEDEAPAPAAPDMLSVLMEMKADIEQLKMASAGAVEIAVEADAKADLALEMDGVVVDEVASVREEVAEALTEPQAAADEDVEPVKVHWLHR